MQRGAHFTYASVDHGKAKRLLQAFPFHCFIFCFTDYSSPLATAIMGYNLLLAPDISPSRPR